MTTRLFNIAMLALALLLGLSAVSLAGAEHPIANQAKPVILWVQEVHGQALYWVNDKLCGRAPLSGLGVATSSNPNTALTVVLDSRVPIREMADIEGLLEKMDVKNVRYYVFDRAYPKIGMSEIVWKPQSVPLPTSPPKQGRETIPAS
jgi:hypothetical protein